MLKDLLDSKKCFKLVCAAGNEDVLEVEKLVTLYSKAGCKFFDLCAKPEVVIAAKRGLNNEGYLCVSIGTKGDLHVRKAQIEDKCIQCGKCIKNCPQNAIDLDFKINETRCIGCAKCAEICQNDAVTFINKTQEIKKTLPPLVELGIDCLELHASYEDEIYENWSYLNQNFDGILSICINNEHIGQERVIKILKKLLSNRKPYTTIIKAEGASMTGDIDNINTTIQTIEIAKILQKENFPAYIMLSGGTNIKSTELAKNMGASVNGVAIGTYARKIVSEYTKRDDFLTNEAIFNQALKIAQELVNSSTKYL